MPGISEWVAVAIGGASGAMLRFGAFLWADRVLPKGLPWGTVLVNVIGSALIGVAFVLLVERGLVSPVWRSFFTVGLLGALTTFSAFSLDAVALIESGALARAALYIVLSVGLCVAAAMIAILLTRAAIQGG
jgi:CrcB protein